jgi:beta-lactamase family protein
MPVGWARGALDGGAIESFGERRAARAWSTMKVPVIVASITCGRADWHAVDAAITRSDNEAALRLWGTLDDAPAQVEAVLRAAGDPDTVLEREPDPRGWSPFGRTVWTLEAGATFYRALARGELLGAADTDRVLDAMGRVVPEQRWGLGQIPDVRFKGGWGPSEAPGGGYEVIQFGIAGDTVLALSAAAADFSSAQELASKHVPQHQNASQLRAAGD